MTDDAIRVAIPTRMRRFTAGASKVSVTGTTLAEALADLGQPYPEHGGRITEDDGWIRRFVNIFVDGGKARNLQREETTVRAGDELTMILAMAGGAAR